MDLNVQSASLGLLVARVVIGTLMAAHGAQKLFGWFGGYGLNTTGEFMVHLGFPSGRAFAFAAGSGEFVSGLLVATGLLGPIGPALMISVMIVAMIKVHWNNGVFATKNGVELPLIYAVAGVAFAAAGYGAYAVDSLIPVAWPATVRWGVLAVGVVGGLANVGISRYAKRAAATSG
jgi:putative oxidoreductase